MAKAKAKQTQEVPTWAYRIGMAAALGVALWFISGLLGDFKDFGTTIQKVRDEVSTVRIDTTAIKKDVERLDKGQQRQDEKAERFERDTQKRFERIEEKIDRKVDKK